jgi:hypothetical protein
MIAIVGVCAHRAPYAAKTFQDEALARNSLIAQRFEQEALVWVKLDRHENVTKAEFVKNVNGQPFLCRKTVNRNHQPEQS